VRLDANVVNGCNNREIDVFAGDLAVAGAADRGDFMHVVLNHTTTSAPSITPSSAPLLSDDECLTRLAKAVEAHDSDRLDEIAWLIGRLAVPIE
jgi:hypothetical protein